MLHSYKQQWQFSDCMDVTLAFKSIFFQTVFGVVGWCDGPGRPTNLD